MTKTKVVLRPLKYKIYKLKFMYTCIYQVEDICEKIYML